RVSSYLVKANQIYLCCCQDWMLLILDPAIHRVHDVRLILLFLDAAVLVYAACVIAPVTLYLLNQELKTVSYHKLYDILKQHQHKVNEIRAEWIARVADPLALVAQQQPVYHPQTHHTHYTHNSSTRSQQAATWNRGKEIQEEAGIQLNAEQADWRDDTDDDELEDRELEAHYMYMAQL
nr:hypothetical protein [Tanacetum cinerariifolium]